MTVNKELTAIEALDLDAIKRELMHPESGSGWPAERAAAAEREYRRFLYLACKHPDEQISPLADVDTFWHQHILDTRKYAADCSEVFGYFLHHFPYLGLRGGNDAQTRDQVGLRTRALYRQAFGDSEAAVAPNTLRAGSYCANVAAKSSYCATPRTEASYCAATVKAASYCAAPGAAESYCAAGGKRSSCAALRSEPNGADVHCAAPPIGAGLTQARRGAMASA